MVANIGTRICCSEGAMKYESIRRYLRPYKIYGRSSTTISYAFASAIAEMEEFDHDTVRQALGILKQTPENLLCAYCGESAQTWDHLVPVVKNGKQFGPGHRIRNLVPCCSKCNGEKGNRDFEAWLPNRFPGWQERIERLRAYLAGEQDDAPLPAEIETDIEAAVAEYWTIRDQIFELLRQADGIAVRIGARRAVASNGLRFENGGAVNEPVPNLSIDHTKSSTIGQLCTELLAEEWQSEAILAEVRRQFPNARTTKACLAWYKSKMKLRAR
jgi:hypothetical protein